MLPLSRQLCPPGAVNRITGLFSFFPSEDLTSSYTALWTLLRWSVVMGLVTCLVFPFFPVLLYSAMHSFQVFRKCWFRVRSNTRLSLCLGFSRFSLVNACTRVSSKSNTYERLLFTRDSVTCQMTTG